MSTKEIEHVSDFVAIIEANTFKYKRNQHFCYRGESRLNYSLLPSLYRDTIEESYSAKTYLSHHSEIDIISQFMTEAVGYINTLSVDNDKFRWIQYAQHFGVPTRLMDWTTNPLVALFFACSANQKEDGRIYILNSLGYNLMTSKDNRNHLDGKTIKEEAEKMIWGNENTFRYPALLKPYFFDRRMVAQSSRFMIWGYRDEPLDKIVKELESEGKEKTEMRKELSEGVIIETCSEIETLSQVIVPKNNKLRLQHELDDLGINHSTLFPGLDGIGKTIEWKYNIRNSDVIYDF